MPASTTDTATITSTDGASTQSAAPSLGMSSMDENRDLVAPSGASQADTYLDSTGRARFVQLYENPEGEEGQ
ncbi:hypothetical protein IAT38_000252 [Cryptococcus sp. DSM 104549]